MCGRAGGSPTGSKAPYGYLVTAFVHSVTPTGAAAALRARIPRRALMRLLLPAHVSRHNVNPTARCVANLQL